MTMAVVATLTLIPLARVAHVRAGLAGARVRHLRASAAAPPSAAWEGAIEPSWAAALRPELESAELKALEAFVREERARAPVFPPEEQTFAAFARTPFECVRCVILGQDPYHQPGQAHGLAFSVPRGVMPPPSLRNILRELSEDLGEGEGGAQGGDLGAWADDGVLLLNTVLSVRASAPASHAGRGWETLTDAAVSALSARRSGLVFILWGAAARRKARLIDASAHLVLEGTHPSPLGANRGGFFGGRYFSRANDYLSSRGAAPVAWAVVLRGAAPTPRAPRADAAAAAGGSGAGGAVVASPSEHSPAPRPDAAGGAAGDAAVSTPAAGGAAVERAAAEGAAGAGAPPRWRAQLDAIEAYRARTQAPVDVVGCHTLGDRTAPPPTFRFQTLVALVLSARTQDEHTARGVAALSALCGGELSASALVALEPADVELALRDAGVMFWRNKARYALECARAALDAGGEPPRELSAVQALPGVGPKVAHLYTQVAWGDVHGIGVDTHVQRVAQRLGWAPRGASAGKTRLALEAWLPRKLWAPLNPLLVGLGQTMCAHEPRCAECPLRAQGLCAGEEPTGGADAARRGALAGATHAAHAAPAGHAADLPGGGASARHAPVHMAGAAATASSGSVWPGAPSDAQLLLAMRLAARAGVGLAPEHLADRHACAHFIDEYRWGRPRRHHQYQHQR